jgi:hypothetical protein
MKNLLLTVFAASLLSAGLVGCFGDKDDTGPETNEGDTDTDTDADGDTDADADADTDADTDVTACPENSGWPCSCTAETCDDGAQCVSVQGMGSGTAGYCAATCSAQGAHGDCPAVAYDAEPYCVLSDGTNWWCALICMASDSECPPGQMCNDTGHGYGICLP